MKNIKVRYNKPNIHTAFSSSEGSQGNKICFMPGINFVDKADISKLLKNKIFKARVDEGEFEILEEDADILKKPIPEVKQIIAEIFDIEILNSLKKEDSRKAIIEAVDKQLELIKPSENDKSKE